VQHINPWETVDGITFPLGDQSGNYTSETYGVTFPLTMEACALMPEDAAELGSYPLAFGDGVSEFGIIWLFLGGVQAQLRIGSDQHVLSDTAGNEGALHILASWENSTTAVLYVNGVVVDAAPGTTSSDPYSFSGIAVADGPYEVIGNEDGVIADVAIYSTDLDATRAAAHGEAFVAPWDGDATGERIERLLDVVEWPSDLRDLAPGFSTLSPAVLGGVALDQMRKCEAAEQGRMFISRDGKLTFHDRYWSQLEAQGSTSQVTFSDAGSDVPYTGMAFDYDDRLVFGRIAGSTSGGYNLTVEDATSLADYGDKTDSTLNGLDVTPDLLRALAEHRLLTYKEPSLRPRPITVALHDTTKVSDAEAEAILELDLGHRVTITRTPLVGSAITQEALVESITHSIKADEWNVTLSLSPAGITSYGLWGDDWGTLTWGP
jgi:hypothetical protein